MNTIIKLHCIFILIVCITFGIANDWQFHGGENRRHHHKDFHVDYFVLAMEWPEGVCEYINATHRHECVISDQVKGWVLHGLWPSNVGHKYLQYCNRSAKFDFDKVKSLQGDLEKYWPNLFADSSKVYLWKHEYEKHGTCAAIVEGFETEKKYFERAMGLLLKYDPKAVLEKRGIVPSRNAYPSEKVIAAMNSGFGNVTCTQCSNYRGVKVLSGVEVCLSKQLEVMECPHCGHKYDCHDNVYYHPINFKA